MGKVLPEYLSEWTTDKGDINVLFLFLFFGIFVIGHVLFYY